MINYKIFNSIYDDLILFPSRIVFWGGTGQAKVMRYVVEYYGSEIIFVVDRTIGLKPPFDDVPLILDSEFDECINRISHDNLGFCITIGNPNGQVRVDLHKLLVGIGLLPTSLIHPTAWIAPNAKIGKGAQIHAGTIIEAETVLGDQCIINTKASVDHECVLGNGVELAPGATLCGNVTVDDNAWVCAGATVLPRIHIGKNSVVGAGAVVIRDVPDNVTVIGVPAKLMIKSV